MTKNTISDLTTLSLHDIDPENIDIDIKRTRLWCLLPYPDHYHGCPNFLICSKVECITKEKLCLYKRLILVVANFNFEKYKEYMKFKFPYWTQRQLENVLYWQNGVKHISKKLIMNLKPDLILSCGSGFLNKPSMEAVGINVVKTMKNIGIDLIFRKPKIIRLVSLVGFNEINNKCIKSELIID